MENSSTEVTQSDVTLDVRMKDNQRNGTERKGEDRATISTCNARVEFL